MASDDSPDISTVAKMGNVPLSLLDEDLLRQRLRALSADSNSQDAIAVLLSMSYMARAYGLLHLEKFLPEIPDPAFRSLLQLVTDGTDPRTVEEIAVNHAKASLAKRSTYLDILRQGVQAIQSGDNPRIVAELLHSIYGTTPPAWTRSNDPTDSQGASETLAQEEIDALLGAIQSDEPAGDIDSGQFESILSAMSDRDIQQLIHSLDGKELAVALFFVSQPVLAKVFRNLSIRRSQILHEDIRFMGRPNASSVADARSRVISTIRRLEEGGDIVITMEPS